MRDSTWTEVPLSDLVAETIGGLWGNPVNSSYSTETDVLVIRGADFRDWDTRRAVQAARRRIPTRALERRRLQPGDLVIEVSGGGPGQPVGRVLIVDERAVSEVSQPLICSNFCRKLRLDAAVDPLFVKQQLEWLYRSGHMDRFQTSSTNIRNLQVEALFEGTTILLPAPATQSDLAALLDAFERKRGSSAEHLSAARAALDRFRRAVLAAASSGRLTSDWRERHPEIAAPHLRANGHAMPASRRRAIDEFDDADLAEVPRTWIWTPLAAISESTLGKMLDRAKNKGVARPYLRNINVRWRGFDFEDVQQMRFEPGEEERYGLRPGDVLVCEGGEPGRAAVWREKDSDMRIQKALHRVRPSKELLPDWLVDVLQAHASAGLLSEYFTGTGISHLTGVSLARVPIPLPPAAEQAELVRRVERLFQLADRLDKRIDAAERAVERSSQAAFARAFRGELSLNGSNGLADLNRNRRRKAI